MDIVTRGGAINVRYEIAHGTFKDIDVYYVTEATQLAAAITWARRQKALGLDLETGCDKPEHGSFLCRCGLEPREGKIATLQIGNPLVVDARVYVIDVRCFTAAQLRPLLDICENPKVTKYGMNIGFEYRFLRHQYGIQLRRVRDIQLAELVIRAGLFPETKEENTRAAYAHTSMARLAKRYLEVVLPKEKELRTSFYKTPPGHHSTEQIIYAAGDTVHPFYIWSPQKEECDNRSLRNILDLEFELLPILAEAQYYGIGLDATEWRQLWQEAVVERSKAQTTLDTLYKDISPQQDLFGAPSARPIYPRASKGVFKELNYDSPAHVKWALATYCKNINWPVEIITTPKRLKALKGQYGAKWLQKARDKGREVTEDDVPDSFIPEDKYCILLSTLADTLRLAMIRKQLPEAPVRGHLAYSTYSQRADAFGIEFINKHVRLDTHRVHPQFHQAIASTGRISTVPNSQNIPHDPRYRKCFKPRKGYKYVILDYSQIEPRLSAQVSGDAVYLATFNDNDDIYLRVAEAMTGTYPDIKSSDPVIREAAKLTRQIFKTIVLALAYRMGPWKLRNRLTLALEKEIMSGKLPIPTIEYARQLRDGFFERCSGIATYQDVCSDAADPNTDRPKIWDLYKQQAVTWIEAPCGRKRFFASDAYGTYTAAPNAPIQGCSATITKAAAVLVQRVIDGTVVHELNEVDAHVVNLVHDEIVWEVREDQAEAFAPMAKECMERAGRLYVTRVPVLAEFPKGTKGVCDHWLKEVA